MTAAVELNRTSRCGWDGVVKESGSLCLLLALLLVAMVELKFERARACARRERASVWSLTALSATAGWTLSSRPGGLKTIIFIVNVDVSRV